MTISKILRKVDPSMKLATYTLIALLILAMTSCQKKQSNNDQAAAPAQDQAPVATAVYIFNSEACDCEKQRNSDAMQAIEFFLKKDGARQPKRIDLAKLPSELEKYQKQTRISFLPVLLGLDDNGLVVEKVEGIFENNEKALENIFF